MHSSRHIFLTGRAGTGKTTFLRHIREQTSKNTVIVAPTGVAAINAGGVTMHSFFQLPMGAFIPGRTTGFSTGPSAGTDLNTLLRNLRFNREKKQLLEELELLIIDEVSMLRADMLDAIDGILRHFRHNLTQPFGGVQVLYIGDMYQLPPVVSNDEWSFMQQYYKSMFFFDALVMQEARPLSIELDRIYRQSDPVFIELLNNIRNNTANEDDLRLLNKHYDPYFFPEPNDGYIILTSHNYKADKINQQRLSSLQSEAQQFEGALTGEFNENALPVDKMLTLKEGAQIMFIRNDKGDQRRFYNGKIGTISRIRNKEIFIRFRDERAEMLLEQETWRNIRYNYNAAADSIQEEELGSYHQYPIRLAWAVTIHKSQGLTFEKAIIDAGQSFAAGQVYVALSRLTSLSGLVLSSEITAAAIQTDERIAAFSRSPAGISSLQIELRSAQKQYLTERLFKCYDWQKTAEIFREFHEGFGGRRMPHQAEAVAWSDAELKQVIALKEIAERFSGQLKQALAGAEQDRYQHLLERVRAAANYFLPEIETRLLKPWKEHFESTRVKAKTKKYLKELQALQAQLHRKKQQIQQTVPLTEGLAEGKDLTTLLNSFQLHIRQAPPATDSSLAPAVKEDSKKISLQLFQQGKDIDDIARERGLARSTIEGHLVHFITSGEVKLNQLVSPENELAIRNAIRNATQKELSFIRNALGNTFSYAEIRAVLLQIEREALM